MMMSASRSVSLALAWVLLINVSASAQFTLRSGISGVVTDTSGAVVPDCTVRLTDVDRNQTYDTTTNSDGLYTFNNLNFGRYRVSVEQPGFRKAGTDVVELASQQAQRIDFSLQPGAPTEVMDVSSDAATIQADQAIVGQVVDRKFIETLPVKGRNFTAFATLAPNVTTSTQSNRDPETYSVGSHQVASNVTYTVGGGGNNGYYLNGVNINDNWVGAQSYTPSTEALVEVKLDVANFSAENGRDVSTFSVATRGGTSEYHGSVYDYFQNSALNAWNPYDKQFAEPGQKQNFFARNQFGGNAGGPIVIPKIFDGRDKLFFFANFEVMIQRETGAGDPVRVPTEAERRGDFSELLRLFPNNPEAILYDPFSTEIVNGESVRTPIPNNDLSRVTRPDGSPLIDPRAQQLLDLFPLPNYQSPIPGDLDNYRAFASNGVRTHRLDSRFDYRWSQNDSLYVNYSRSWGLRDTTGGVFPDLSGDVEDRSYVVTVNYARVFTPNLTNEFIFGIGKGTFYSVDTDTIAYMNRTDTLRNQFFQNLGTGEDIGVYAMQIEGFPQAGFEEVFSASNPTLQFADNVSWLNGSHQWKFGFNYFRKKEVDWDFIRTVSFNQQFTRSGSANIDANGNNIGHQGGDGLASFLIGLPSSMQQRFDFGTGDARDPLLDFAIPYWGFYAEDKIQVTPNLTATLGLRYDLSIPTYSPSHYGSALIDFNYPGWQLAIPGLAEGVPLHVVKADKNNFAPRISLAYRVRPDFVARASYGVFFDQGIFNVAGSRLDNAFFGGTPGYAGDVFTNDRLGLHEDLPGYTLDDIFPAQATVQLGTYPISTGIGSGYFDYQADIRFDDPDSGVVPYYQRYMLELQKAVGSNTIVSLTYLGARGAKLPYYENVNLPSYQLGRSFEEFQEARPNNNGRFGDVGVLRHGLNSFYNAVTVKAERNLSDGLHFLAHYTFSKTVIDRADAFEQYGGYQGVWAWNRHLGRGEAQFSHPHRFVSAVTYETPEFGKLPAFFESAVAGWRISVITQFESGDALTVFNDVTDARDFEPNMPNISGDPNLPRGERTPFRYFDTSAFSAPPQDVKGNAGPGIVRGPGVNNWDISFAKVFRITERFSTEFRGDLFNAFNHTQWRNIDTNFSTEPGNTFGQVTEAREARIVQLGLKFSF
jgi:hypothetical protein